MLFPKKKKPPGKLIRGGFLLPTVFTYSLTDAATISAPIIIMPAIANGPQNGARTHNQDQLITPVNFSATNNTPNKLITPFISIYFKLQFSSIPTFSLISPLLNLFLPRFTKANTLSNVCWTLVFSPQKFFLPCIITAPIFNCNTIFKTTTFYVRYRNTSYFRYLCY